MSLQGKSFKLADGHSIPAVAYGVGTRWFKLFRNDIDEQLIDTIGVALGKGFVHIDGAEVYNTDIEIGKAIAKVDRSKLYLTDKFSVGDKAHQVWSQHGLPHKSLKYHSDNQLHTTHVDLYLLHSPYVEKDCHGFTLAEAWQSMEKAVEDGLTKSIGVSNFAVDDLKEILAIAKIKPVVNQIEFNAYLQDQTPGVVEFCKKNDILIEAYCPLGPIVKGEPGEFTELLAKIGEKYGKTPEQVLLRWVLENDILPVTTSSNETRISQFVDIFDFQLTNSEVEELTALGKKHPTLRQYWTAEYGHFD